MTYSPFLSCRQAARIITAQFDRPLSPLERLKLRLHLTICAACPIVIDQLAELRRSMVLLRESAETS